MIEKTTTVGMITRVRVSLTVVAKSPAASLKAYPAATTEEVSFTAVPVHRPYARFERFRYRPMIGKAIIMNISKIKVALSAYAISKSSASMTGAIAAIAEPPQIPVPAEIRFDNFQSRPRNLPIK